jgi:lipid A 4'-phosphatase
VSMWSRRQSERALRPAGMSYLRTQRARGLLLCFAISSLLLVAFSDLDLLISRLFFDHGFHFAAQLWTKLLHEAVGVLIAVSMVGVIGIYAFNNFSQRTLCGIDGRKVLYLLLVLMLGAGLIVNVVFKNHFGRARPRDLQEFGGSRQFTPAFVVADQCSSNCSFSSGDAAGAFFFMAFAIALSRRRLIAVAAVGFGVAVSLSRIAIGAHFFSDTVVSFFVMLIVADALYHYMFVLHPGAIESALAPSHGLLLPLAEKLAAAATDDSLRRPATVLSRADDD